jgi:predicted nuclease of predicted toxin-antitoxin system
MRLLLDENLPKRLKQDLKEQNVIANKAGLDLMRAPKVFLFSGTSNNIRSVLLRKDFHIR